VGSGFSFSSSCMSRARESSTDMVSSLLAGDSLGCHT
jgi:hypothetical protein